MKTLVIAEYPSKRELDRVTLTDDGRLEYDTGAARDMFEPLAASLGVTPEQVFDLRTDWSNGYVTAKLAPSAAV